LVHVDLCAAPSLRLMPFTVVCVCTVKRKQAGRGESAERNAVSKHKGAGRHRRILSTESNTAGPD
jgi:hypothetical protein